jgi:hypothetical protein
MIGGSGLAEAFFESALGVQSIRRLGSKTLQRRAAKVSVAH